MRDTERRLVAALEHNAEIAAQVIATMAELTLCQIEEPVLAVAVGTGEKVTLLPPRVIGLAEWRLFDQLVAQLREAKAASAELVRELSEDVKKDE